ncbi:hypothetical protein [Gordonia crocea]|nr:hypothetical protein [Gordonia crocea]
MKHQPLLSLWSVLVVVVGLVASALVVTGAAGAASAAPDATTISPGKFATPGGHGNFRWRYSSSAKNLCGIYPAGRSYVVRCAAKIPAADGSGASKKFTAIEIGSRGVKRTTSDGDAYPGAKRLYPHQAISVVGITCTAAEGASVTCETNKGAFSIVGGVAHAGKSTAIAPGGGPGCTGSSCDER